MFRVEWQERLGQRLCALAGMEKAFFCNSGAEANEAALKLARLRSHRRRAQPQIVVMENGFHGRTLATLSATGNPAKQQGFEPLLPGFLRVPYDDIAAVRQLAEQRDDIVAVLLEPVQGEGGIRVAGADYLRDLRALCDRHGWLLMLDEIQAGMGRTGAWFGHQHAGIAPDVMTLAKALGNGFPIGACLARGPAADLFSPGQHGSTFGGNPLACRVACTVLDIMARDGMPQRAPRWASACWRAAAGAGRSSASRGGARPGPDGRRRAGPQLPGTCRPGAGRTAPADHRDPRAHHPPAAAAGLRRAQIDEIVARLARLLSGDSAQAITPSKAAGPVAAGQTETRT